ncbi:MAG: isocitrate lyase, partial [Pseudomonadota bacterium]|nr:isocitrate lyase [Pseudomonadota bacterium]
MTLSTQQAEQAKALEQSWKNDARWAQVKRPYSAEEVVKLRGSLQVQHTYAQHGADKLWRLINGEAQQKFGKDYVNALGALTGGQAVQQVKAGLQAIYLSGWQVAADNNSSRNMYPDQSLYPVDSVPTVVERINNSF